MKSAWVFQHVPFEGPGAIGPWLEARGYQIRIHRWWEAKSPPALMGADFVVSMGGPMSVHDTAEYPWLSLERAWMAAALRRGVPMLGVCLGAQQMAAALGASVGPNPEKEIGWFPVRGVEDSGWNEWTGGASECTTVLHWHGDTFDLPEGAVRLAGSEGCSRQAFALGKRALGLQFHLEATAESLDRLLTHCRHELAPGRWVQTEEELRSGWETHAAAAHAVMDRVLRHLTES